MMMMMISLSIFLPCGLGFCILVTIHANYPSNVPFFSHTLPCDAGLTALVSLSVSNSRITNAGLQHLKQLKNLKSLTLDSCKVTVNDIKKLQSKDLPNLVSFRPE